MRRGARRGDAEANAGVLADDGSDAVPHSGEGPIGLFRRMDGAFATRAFYFALVTPVASTARLDALRGIASFVVLLAHAAQIFLFRILGRDHPASFFFSSASHFAVIAFFILSGHLVTISILRNARRNRNFDPVSYALSRAARIYPPLLGSFVIVALVGWLIETFDLPGAGNYGLPGELFTARENYKFEVWEFWDAIQMENALLSVNGPLWSLFIEVRIYVLAAGVAMAVLSRSLTYRVFGLVLAASSYVNGFGVSSYFLFYLLAWSCGAVLAIWPEILRISALTVVVLAVLFFGGLAWLAPQTLNYRSLDSLATQAVQIGVCMLAAVAMLRAWSHAGPNVGGWHESIGSSLLAAMARQSYSLYIIHFPLLLLALSLSQGWIGLSFERTLVAMAVASTSIVLIAAVFARALEAKSTFERLLAPLIRPLGRVAAWGAAMIDRRIDAVRGLVGTDGKPRDREK